MIETAIAPLGDRVARVAPAMRTSIALCTYNGEAYIAEQLKSILEQTRRPSEIVIFDDCSTDGTVAVAESILLADAHPQKIAWQINVNSSNVGVSRNFCQASEATTADIVFLCDQDDVWQPNKIAHMTAEFENDPDLTLVHTDARLIGDAGLPLGLDLFDALELRPEELALISHGMAFRVLIRRNVVTGATCAFRRTLLDVAVPFPADWVHDEWLAIIAAATGKIKCIPERLTDYRQHATNQIGIRKRSIFEKVRHMFARRGDFYKRQVHRADLLISQLDGVPAASDKLRDLTDWKKHLAFRADLPPNRLKRLPCIRQEIISGRYSRYSLGLRSVVRDVLEGQ